MKLVFDLEANGLYFDVTSIHCLCAKDVETGTIYKFRPNEVEQGFKLLMQADTLIGHNIINYDIPAIQKLYPWFNIPLSKVVDTLVLSRLLYADMGDTDDVIKKVPSKLRGSHSLKAWGYRLGFNKLEFDQWEHYSEEMLEYNVIDVEVTHRLYDKLKPKADNYPIAVELEHAVAWVCAEQERTGFGFNKGKAYELNAKLIAERAELEGELQRAFPPFYLPNGGEYVPKAKVTYPDKVPTENGFYTGEVIEVSLTDKEGNLRTVKRRVYQGYPAQKLSLTIFNPGSRHHIAHRLTKVRGWKPSEFTPNGQAKIDETILSGLPWPEAKLLARYFLIQKRISMLSEGDGAWLNFLRDGRIHGGINTNGAVTGRATHHSPNLAQVPSVGAVYGAECRELFEPGRSKVQVGVDVSGLELRMLAHYLARYDGGSYGLIVCEGDVHWTTVQAVGLTSDDRDETRLRIHKLFRNAMKTFIYAFLYGAGSIKIGTIILEMILEIKKNNLPYEDLMKQFFKTLGAPGEKRLASCGKMLKERFMERIPGLKKLIETVETAAKRGYLIGLDGRRLAVRSPHAALNTLLQSAGALVCKRWMIEVEQELQKRGWKDRVKQMGWIHDEIQFECDPDIADDFGKMAEECISKSGQFFNIRLPLTGEAKQGANWKECH